MFLQFGHIVFRNAAEKTSPKLRPCRSKDGSTNDFHSKSSTSNTTVASESSAIVAAVEAAATTSSDDEFVAEKEEDGVIFLYGDDEVYPIFFEEDSDNFGETPKFDGDGCEFIEDKLVFEDDEVIFHSESPRMLEEVLGNAVVEKYGDNYPVKKVVEIKVKFAIVKHFCSLTNIMDDKLVGEVLQSPHNGVSVDNFDLSIEVSSNVSKIHVPLSDDKFFEIVFEEEFTIFEDFVIEAHKTREKTKTR
ncbi:hypothetical protein Scep_004149 [Stephania cephalantha]|uniref:Uncharacterized protein n=1 Tax=Stephania cephalantha TaxID=152367 RepID=A0AAP0KUF6_9MAGN